MEYVKLDKLDSGESHALVLNDDELVLVTILLGSVIGSLTSSWRTYTDAMFFSIHEHMDSALLKKYEQYLKLQTGEITALSRPKT